MDPWESWCPTCTHAFRAVNSVAEVRNGYGDVYYFDSRTQLFHIRVIELDPTFATGWPYFSDQNNLQLSIEFFLLNFFLNFFRSITTIIVIFDNS